MRAEAVTKALGGRWFGSYGMARCPAHEDRRPSLSIRDGEAGRLLLFCHAGCEYPAIRDQLPMALESLDAHPRRSASTVFADSAARARLIDIIWSGTRSIDGTLAEDYLRNRAVRCPLPRSLRFHTSLRHPSGAHVPAMVARIDMPGSELTGVHRTYLSAGKPTKSELQPVKAMLGKCAGGAVRLRAGKAALVVCEGIETGLSLCDALNEDFSVWAALSTSGVRRLRLPEPHFFGGLLIVATDGDQAGRTAGQELAKRAAGQKWTVETISAPDGLDYNDLAQRRVPQ